MADTIHLVVGDPHVTPDELPECESLLELVLATIHQYRSSVVTFLGDQHHNHDAVSVRVQDFWYRWLQTLRNCARVFFIRGNHDQAYPDRPHPHALQVYAEFVDVVDRTTFAPNLLPGVAWVPYHADHAQFLHALGEAGSARTVFCHQQITGAVWDNGYAADGGVDLPAGPELVISGHMHRPQRLLEGRVVYPGAPRWRTRADANVDRYLLVLEHADDGSVRTLVEVPTDEAVRRIWTAVDRPDAPANLGMVTDRPRDLVYVDVYGPNPVYVREREAALRALGCRTRGYPDRREAPRVSESLGVREALRKFAEDFQAPNGTPSKLLLAEVEKVLGWSS